MEKYIKLAQKSFSKRKHLLYKGVATIKILFFFPLIVRSLKKASGCKKNARDILSDMLKYIWRYRAWVDVYCDSREFIDSYFATRLYSADRQAYDYSTLNETMQAFFYSSIPAIKKMKELEDKETCYAFLQKKGFPHPRRLGHLVYEGTQVLWKTPENKLFPWKEIFKKYPKVFVKPADGCQGKDCFLLHMNQKENEYLINHLPVDNKALRRHITKDLLVEEVIENHPVVASLHPHSLNTVRMITVRNQNGDFRILGSALRVGVAQSSVDNFKHGGIGVIIKENGELSSTGITRDYTKAPISEHPDTLIPFATIQLPYWEECEKLALEMHKKAGRISCVGWDIAITPTGPICIEANPFCEFGIFIGNGVSLRKLLETDYIPKAQKNVEKISNLASNI